VLEGIAVGCNYPTTSLTDLRTAVHPSWPPTSKSNTTARPVSDLEPSVFSINDNENENDNEDKAITKLKR